MSNKRAGRQPVLFAYHVRLFSFGTYYIIIYHTGGHLVFTAFLCTASHRPILLGHNLRAFRNSPSWRKPTSLHHLFISRQIIRLHQPHQSPYVRRTSSLNRRMDGYPLSDSIAFREIIWRLSSLYIHSFRTSTMFNRSREVRRTIHQG